jgi:hypothetical protein
MNVTSGEMESVYISVKPENLNVPRGLQQMIELQIHGSIGR